MAESFIGEISPVAFNFAPRGWALCNGQILSIQQNTALFSLLGTTFGGDGIRAFALPDLRSRVSVHSQSEGAGLGTPAGVESVTLSIDQIPLHSHAPACVTSPGSLQEPSGALWAGSSSSDSLYQTAPTGLQSMANNVITPTGGSQGHPNLQPFLVVNFIIALQGVFPSRN